jgi:large subunit ribosomal protein L5
VDLPVVENSGTFVPLTDHLEPELQQQFLHSYTNSKMVLAKKSVSNFKVREGAPSGFMVTLRRERMWSFMDRFINLATPRIKDFRGLGDRAFDKGGSYSCGLTEQSVWPEINMANVNFSHGMNINIVFRNSNPKMSRFALGELGMPFERRDENGKRIA